MLKPVKPKFVKQIVAISCEQGRKIATMANYPNLGPALPASPPLFPAAVYELPSLAALEAIGGGAPGFSYARDQHPNSAMLEAELARMHAAEWAVVTGSGMAALSLACLAALAPGERLLLSDQLYGRTFQLGLEELPRLGIHAETVDTLNLSAVAAALSSPHRPPARLLLVETITNPLVQVTPLKELAVLCGQHGCKLLVDNTFATPGLCQPLRLGATWVMESLTKFVSGHADVTLGLLAGNDGSLARLRHLRSVWGCIGSPFDCWLCQRGLPTLEVRLEAACRTAAALAEWLPRLPAITRVWYPQAGERARFQGSRGGTMLSFELSGGRPAVEGFLEAGQIPFCPSLGDVRTTVSYPYGASHRFLPAVEKQRLGITEGMLRLSVGLEPVAELQQRLEHAVGK